jgi:hypothetical protein
VQPPNLFIGLTEQFSPSRSQSEAETAAEDIAANRQLNTQC